MQTIATVGSGSVLPARWNWLWTPKRDLIWSFAPFWAGFAMLAVLFATRNTGAPLISFAGRDWNIFGLALGLYGPLVDAPHLWATIARTYTDRDEWAERRSLFLWSLLALVVGPAMILLPYALRPVLGLPLASLDWGWRVWMVLFPFYAVYHVYKQHWGFVCLYKRKNGDNDAAENRADAWFFPLGMWLPYFTMFVLPSEQGGGMLAAAAPYLRVAFHGLFLLGCAAYVGFQIRQLRRGVVRNGPKLLYVATVVGLYYLAFAWDPRVAAYWTLTTGLGHCFQYHAVVWAYGKKQYAPANASGKRLPSAIFASPFLYIVLALVFSFVTLQGMPGAAFIKSSLANVLQVSVLSYTFPFLNQTDGLDLGTKVIAAMAIGVRLHHFYVDSKIWRVSKQPTVARNLGVG